ncbi:MAG: type II toxin-antitoxin system RelE/ParE family toxin [Thermoplasmata archaeon]|nr:type II toxin-antitoxin system RelE/ParE family toxin [Thermoplasmata archaeon]
MADIEIRLTKSAEREFERLGRETQRRFAEAIELLRENAPKPRPGLDVRTLKGLKGMWRLRVGDYRGIYQREGSTATFTRFSHRSKVY